jgi:hypothetical protein
MANVEKEMRLRPARWPLDTLDACIRDFLWRRAPGGGMDVKADDIPAMCAEADTFAEAVWIACASRRRNGKMHSHQTKVSVGARRQFGWEIIGQVGSLVNNLVERNSFDDFYDILRKIRPAGIGPLTTYDVGTRIGAYLRLEPDKIYLHTGARLGWDAMWGERRTAGVYDGRVGRNFWPPALLQLSADMAEDFLCTYRDALKGIQRNQYGVPI